MNDQQFLHAFENATLHPFKHRDHILVAWLYLRRDGWEAGYNHIRSGIQHFAQAHGATTLYHETITRFWAQMVLNAMQAAQDVSDFTTFEQQHPQLFDKLYIEQFYSRAYLFSSQAREQWIEPDLQAMPD
jgi:hypothetical protein